MLNTNISAVNFKGTYINASLAKNRFELEESFDKNLFQSLVELVGSEADKPNQSVVSNLKFSPDEGKKIQQYDFSFTCPVQQGQSEGRKLDVTLLLKEKPKDSILFVMDPVRDKSSSDGYRIYGNCKGINFEYLADHLKKIIDVAANSHISQITSSISKLAELTADAFKRKI